MNVLVCRATLLSLLVGGLWLGTLPLGLAADGVSLPSRAVKWHPGHYYALMNNGKQNPEYLAQAYRELEATPALRGAQIRYAWPELEPSEGRYDFSLIEQALAASAARHKRLIIFLQTKSFNPQVLPVPDYLRVARAEGGAFLYGKFRSHEPKGYNLALWNAEVRDRLIALVQALGARFNAHPAFEGIGLPETAMGEPIAPSAARQVEQFYENLLRVHRAMRAAFPNTMTFQFVNYPRSILPEFIGGLQSAGVGLGGPDTFPDDPGLSFNGPHGQKGVYRYYPELAGIVPLTPSVMQSNYVNTRADGKGRPPTLPELLAFTRDRLKANYVFWTRAPGFYPQLLEMLNGLPATGDPARGLHTTCPQVYPACSE